MMIEGTQRKTSRAEGHGDWRAQLMNLRSNCFVA